MAFREDIERELQRRRAKEALLPWCELALEPLGQKPARQHKLLIHELQKVADGTTDRLLVTMPPGSAKSSYASVLFPAWWLGRFPSTNIIGASHTSDLAEAFSRRVMATVRDNKDVLGISLATENVAAWSTTNGCEYKAAGIGGPVTGRRADLVVVDDPVKSRSVAESGIERERAWHWFLADLRTRLRPGARIVLIMTRWHEDDLAGRLLASQPDRWRTLCLPAEAEENDPLGRKPGEMLWTDDPSYPYGADLIRTKHEYQLSAGERDWQSLYQGAPRPAEGALFKLAAVQTIDVVPADGTEIRGWDLAVTKSVGAQGGDWTVGVKIKKHHAGTYTVTDVVRLRGAPEQVEQAILNTAGRDGKAVKISLPQDPGSAGKAWSSHLVRLLAGYVVEASRESGDKATRAAPVASQVNAGHVSLLRAHWNNVFLDELAGFPAAKFDDQVDALSRAFSSFGETYKGQGMFELMRREYGGKDAPLSPTPEPPKIYYAPGSVEHTAQMAQEAALRAAKEAATRAEEEARAAGFV